MNCKYFFGIFILCIIIIIHADRETKIIVNKRIKYIFLHSNIVFPPKY